MNAKTHPKKTKKAAPKASKTKKVVSSKSENTLEKLYEIRHSGIHNKGLFARVDIPAGTRIIEYLGERITKAESQRRANAWEEKARTSGDGLVYIFEINKRYDIDGNVPYNDARLINHACETNCEAENARGRIWIIAKRDIKAGEELFYDYGYDIEHFFEHPCHCGFKNCAGFIVSEAQRDRVRKLVAAVRKRT
jgi:hypothetical protein